MQSYKKFLRHVYLAAVTTRAGLKRWKVINLMVTAARTEVRV